MGYVSHSPYSFSSAKKLSAYIETLDGGVNFGADPSLIDGSQASAINDFLLEDGVLRSRKAVRTLPQDNISYGTLHSYSGKRFCGSFFFHAGTLFCRTDGRGVYVMLDDLPDEDSVIVEFGGKIYVFCHARFYSADRNFEAKEEFPFAPTHRTSFNGRDTTSIRVSSFRPNILAPYVSVTYLREDTVNGFRGYIFPDDMDHSRKFCLYLNGELLDDDKYTYDNTSFYLVGVRQTQDNTLKICYYSTNPDYDKSEKLSGCLVAESFGGGTLDGTRLFLAGNPDYPGVYFMSEIADPLCFYEDSCNTIGQGSEDIRAFAKQYGYMLTFTDSTVSRISYSYSESTGGYYSVKLINSSVGCDVPQSVATVDNKTVFVNSKSGVFIVDSTDNYDEMNIVPISHNIIDSKGEKGLFSASGEEIKNAKACDADGKYLLLVGNRAYVWDYGARPYVSSSNYKDHASKLVWLVLSDIDADVLFGDGRELFGFGEDCGCVVFDDGGGTVDAYVETKNTDLSYPHAKKTVTAVRFDCMTGKKCRAAVRIYADGNKYFEHEEELCPSEDNKATFFVRVPKYAAEKFRFAISTKDPDVGILGIRVDYTVLKRNNRE